MSGWCHRIRDHGGVLFIDLRDHYAPDAMRRRPGFAGVQGRREIALWNGWCGSTARCAAVPVERKIRNCRPARSSFTSARSRCSARPGELPLPVFGEQEYPEDIRLKYRFLDLRREKLHQNIMTRGAIVDSMRKRMKEQGFFEFQTPILTASSPEGARDFLVPSRIHPGKILRAAAGAAAVQAAPDDVGLRSLLPDRAVFPR